MCFVVSSGELTWLSGKYPCFIINKSWNGPFSITMLVYCSLTKLPFMYVSKWCKPKSIRFLVPCSSGFWRFPNHTHFCHNQWPPCRVLGSTAISGGLCLLFRQFWWPPMKTKALGAFKWSQELGWIQRCFVITLNMVGSYPLNGYIHDTKKSNAYNRNRNSVPATSCHQSWDVISWLVKGCQRYPVDMYFSVV